MNEAQWMLCRDCCPKSKAQLEQSKQKFEAMQRAKNFTQQSKKDVSSWQCNSQGLHTN